MQIGNYLSKELSGWKAKLKVVFFWPKRFHGVSLLMYVKWRRVKLWGWCMVFWQHYFTREKRTMKNRFLWLERNLYSMRLVKIIVKTVIYVICDKYEFLVFLFSNCYQIPQLNYNFKRLAVSLHHIILMVNIMLTFVEKICFILINVSACP